MSDWEQANLQGGSAYEPVSNLRFEWSSCPALAWERPAGDSDDTQYSVFLSADGGASWRELYASEWNFMVPGYKIPAGTYDRVKVATLVNGQEVTAAEEAISLTVTEGATLPAASLTLSPITGGGYACTVTGLTPEASFGLFFRSADGTDDDHVGILRADSAGNCTDTLRINERVTAYYRIDEYSNSAISADGKTASYTASSRGGWIPVAQTTEYSEDVVFIKSVSSETGDGYISQTVYLPDGSKETWEIDDGESYSGGKFYTYRTNSDGFCELDEADAMEVAKNFVWSDEEGVILNATIAKDALYGTLLTVTAGGYTISDIETKGAKFVDLHGTDDTGAYDRTVGSLSRLCDLVDDERVKTVEMFLNVSRDGAVTIFVTTINV